MPIQNKRVGKPGGKLHHIIASVPKAHQTRKEQNLDQKDSLFDATDSSLFHLTGSTQVQPFGVMMMVDTKPLQMEIDTGATSSLVAGTTLARQGTNHRSDSAHNQESLFQC